MKKLWTGVMALTAMAGLMACDDSSSSSSFEIPTYGTEAALPDSCSMEVAKVDTTYFACFENKWVEIKDSAIVEQFKKGLDEEKVKAKLEELEDLLKQNTPAIPKSSDSKESDEEVQSSDSEEPESSDDDEEECTGRHCKDKSSSSKNSGSDNGSENGGGSDSDPESSSAAEGGDTESSDSGSLVSYDDVAISASSSLLYGKSTTISVIPSDAVSQCVINVDNKDYEDQLPASYDCSFEITNNNTGTENITLTFTLDEFKLNGEGQISNGDKTKTIVLYYEGFNFGRNAAFEFLDKSLTWKGAASSGTIVFGDINEGISASQVVRAIENKGFTCETKISGSGKQQTTSAECSKVDSDNRIGYIVNVILDAGMLKPKLGDVQTRVTVVGKT